MTVGYRLFMFTNTGSVSKTKYSLTFNLNKNISKMLFYKISFAYVFIVIIVIFESLFSQGIV